MPSAGNALGGIALATRERLAKSAWAKGICSRFHVLPRKARWTIEGISLALGIASLLPGAIVAWLAGTAMKAAGIGARPGLPDEMGAWAWAAGGAWASLAYPWGWVWPACGMQLLAHLWFAEAMAEHISLLKAGMGTTRHSRMSALRLRGGLSSPEDPDFGDSGDGSP